MVRESQKHILITEHIMWYKYIMRSEKVKLNLIKEALFMFGLTPYNRKNEEQLRKNGILSFRNAFDDFFNEPLLSTFFETRHPIRADIRETEKEYIVEAEMPGANKEDIKLDLRNDTLTIAVEHNEQVNEEKENYLRKERRFGSYSRSFYVENVKNEDVTAKYDNGVLTIKLPKTEDRSKDKHKIEIQ